MLTIEEIKKVVAEIAPKYQITKATLFGSRARGNNRDDSDVDLIVEFETYSVSLLKIFSLKYKLEEIFNVGVDIVHGPVEAEDMLEIDKEVEIYAA